jgi:hypothetical protein
MTTEDDPWMTGEEIAVMLGISWSTWRSYLTRLTHHKVPLSGRGVRVDPVTRRRQWRRSTVEAWNKGRPGRGYH